MTKGSSLLAAAIADQKLTQSEVAERIGVSQGTVSDWESGKNTPKLVFALRMLDTFGIPVGAWAEPENRTAEG
jgi:transcriptional regulator with XRE-family HTH domain